MTPLNRISNQTTFKDLDSINPYPGTKTAGRRSGPNQRPFTAGAGFSDILSAFQTQRAKNTFKSRGLTISDYRARPVVSKSRCRSQLESFPADSKNTVANQFAEDRLSAVIQKDTLKSRRLCAPKMDPVASTEKPETLTDPYRTGRAQQQIIAQQVHKAAAKYNLSPELINAVIRAESNFEVRAVSSAGAQGLMQLMPATARELGVEDPFDIEQNIDGGVRYLRKMLDRFGGSVRQALAAYNAGPETVSKYGGRVPYPETRQYVQRVLRFSGQTV